MIPNSTALSNGAPNVVVYFAYDYASRRIGKTVVDKRVAPTVTKHISYAYDQWNPVAIWERAILVAPLVLKHTQLWGLDIGSSGTVDAGASASFQQAGGVGGLISSTHLTSNPITSNSYIPSFDANGNIIAWTAGDGTLLRKIDYDAFGNEVMVENYAAPATIAKLPEFGFSTKIKDAETGLSYYGYRYYDPKTGRWPSRDPIEEEGGVNLYGFVFNRPTNLVDSLGLSAQILIIMDFKNHGSDAAFLATTKTKLRDSKKLASDLRVELEAMSDEDFKEKTDCGIFVFWWPDKAGMLLKEIKKKKIDADRTKLITWIKCEEASKIDFIQTATDLTAVTVLNKISRMKGNAEYEFDSVSLVVHGRKDKGALLGIKVDGTRVAFGTLSSALKGLQEFESTAITSCGANDGKDVSSGTRQFQRIWKNMEKHGENSLTITPFQSGYSPEN